MLTRAELSVAQVEELQQSLQQRLTDAAVPSLPQVAVKIIELVADPSASLQDFAKVIRTDQALTGRLLRMSNSAAFGQRNKVTTLERAVVLLGLDRTKALALGFHLSQAATKDDFSKRIWTQSLFRAWLAFQLTESINKSSAGEAFIIGLMLDAGIPLMPKLIGDSYQSLISESESPGARFTTEFAKLPFTHVDVAAAMCRKWNMPESLVRPIELHHTRPKTPDLKLASDLLHSGAFTVGLLPLVGDLEKPEEPLYSTVAAELFRLDGAGMKAAFSRAAKDLRASQEVFASIMDAELSVEKILNFANQKLADIAEGYIERTANEEAAKIAQFDTGELLIEVERATDHRVKVYVSDTDGVRLLAEEIDLSSQSHEQLRQILLLDTAPEQIAEEVVQAIRLFAA